MYSCRKNLSKKTAINKVLVVLLLIFIFLAKPLEAVRILGGSGTKAKYGAKMVVSFYRQQRLLPPSAPEVAPTSRHLKTSSTTTSRGDQNDSLADNHETPIVQHSVFSLDV